MNNEGLCPIPLELLALMMRADQKKVASIVTSMPMDQRAALAAFCISRCHMRPLAFQVAQHCDARSLRIFAGAAGEVLLEQARNQTFDQDPAEARKPKVTLARCVA
ncbi:hypothetical protein [Consotaella salsifontis]|uniref:Uncharacterized protein n=1 Tax=Consotaella salsifontis TaxID=1365950 RepID=A0A1T4T276_9HYPH|nr:hypothetical protein [Consotaella salsifontis]SKA34585.1 hypothetical protein SAMN05428963_11771 [Consotaella salsifontis]